MSYFIVRNKNFKNTTRNEQHNNRFIKQKQKNVKCRIKSNEIISISN